MPSPFPGMDPWLEDPDAWPGVHALLASCTVSQLQPRLRARGYYIDINERVWLEESSRSIYPDVAVIQRPSATVPSATGGTIAAEPVRLKRLEEELREPFLEIRDKNDHRLVTSIEFLSPANKSRGKGNQLFRRKQHELMRGAVNLVEIDLLRGGRHTLAVPLDLVDRLRPWHYLVCVLRPQGEDYEVYPLSIREPLPAIHLPLRAGDADAMLDLQSVIACAYDIGPYPDRINYRREPNSPLAPDDAAWADGLLRRAGLRADAAT